MGSRTFKESLFRAAILVRRRNQSETPSLKVMPIMAPSQLNDGKRGWKKKLKKIKLDHTHKLILVRKDCLEFRGVFSVQVFIVATSLHLHLLRLMHCSFYFSPQNSECVCMCVCVIMAPYHNFSSFPTCLPTPPPPISSWQAAACK